MTLIQAYNTNLSIPLNAFEELTSLCTKHNWTMINKTNELIYKYEKKELIFRFFKDKIEISIPLNNGDMNYTTKFDNYYNAIEYGIHSFKYYIDNLNIT